MCVVVTSISQVSVGGTGSEDRRTDMTVYHLLSLDLLSRLHYGDDEIAADLLSNVIFNIDFLRQVYLIMSLLFSLAGKVLFSLTRVSLCFFLCLVVRR